MSHAPLPVKLNPNLKSIADGSRVQGVWQLAAGYRWPYMGAGVALAVSTLARTASLVLIQYFIDNFLIHGDRTYGLWLIALGFVLLAALQGGFTFISSALSAHTAESITRQLRNFLLDHIQRLRFAYHDETPTGELIQRATSDVDALRRFYAIEFVESTRILFLFIINFAAIYWLNAQLAWISIIVIPIILLISVYFFRLISRAYEAYQEQEAVLTTRLQENLTGVRVVKAFARQSFEEAKFEEANLGRFQRGKRLLLMNSLYWPVTDVLCGIQMLVGYGVGALMAINGDITVGAYLAYAGMLLMVIWPMRNLGRLVVEMSRGLVSFDRVGEIVRQVSEPMTETGFTPPPRLAGELVFENIRFAYGATPAKVLSPAAITAAHKAAAAPAAATISGSQEQPTVHGNDGLHGNLRDNLHDNLHSSNGSNSRAPGGNGAAAPSKPAPSPTVALSDISFTVKPGQRVALLGATGAGKTTLVNLLPRFYDYTGGRILLDGRELTAYSRNYLRSQIGIVEQEPFLFSRTIRDNITFSVGRDVPQEQIEEAAKAAAIHDVILTKLPQGYNTLIGERGTTLSGGQKQRVAIARTLLKDPRILILDDSTSAVDTETEASIRGALERLMQNRTTFIIAHRIQSVMDADLILVMNKGRIVQAGAHDDLIRQPGMYQRIYAAQTRIENELQKELNRVESA